MILISVGVIIMRLMAIANITNGQDTIGLRILDTENKQVRDVPIDNITEVLNSKSVKVDNLDIKDGKIIGSNGSIDRLPKIVNEQILGKSPLIIISQLEDDKYRVSDFKGMLADFRTEEVIKYAQEHGISNGKIVSKDGTEFVSSITGTYFREIEQTTQTVYKYDDEESIRESVKRTYQIIMSELSELGFSAIDEGQNYDGIMGVFMSYKIKYEGVGIRLKVGYYSFGLNLGPFKDICMAYRFYGVGRDFIGREKIKTEWLYGSLTTQRLEMPNIENNSKFYDEVLKFSRQSALKIKESLDNIIRDVTNNAYIIIEGTKVSEHLTNVTCNVDIRPKLGSWSNITLEGTDGNKFKATHNLNSTRPCGRDSRYEVCKLEVDGKWAVVATLGREIDIHKMGKLVGHTSDGAELIIDMLKYWKLAIEYIESTFCNN